MHKVIDMAKDKSKLTEWELQQSQYAIDVLMFKEAYAKNIGDAKKKALTELVKDRLKSISERATGLLDAVEKGYDVTNLSDNWLQHYSTEIVNAISEFNLMQRAVENTAWAVASELKERRKYPCSKCHSINTRKLGDDIIKCIDCSYATKLESVS